MRLLLFAMLVSISVLFPTANMVAATKDQVEGASGREYRLGPGDKIRLTVFGEEKLSGDFTVSGSGKLSLPLIGEVDVGGSTLPEAQKLIGNRFGSGYVRQPRVSAEVVEYRPFYILGEVNKPGQYPFRVGLTVHQAVATAQGFTYRANTRRVLIKRDGSDREVEVRLSASTAVEPGDTIRIKERFW